MKAITLESKLPNAGHYVPGMISGQTLYISGQLPVHHETGAPMAPDLAQQTQDALHNVERVLLAAGCGREDVVLCRVYISDIALWDEVNAVYAAFFGSHKPARVDRPHPGAAPRRTGRDRSRRRTEKLKGRNRYELCLHQMRPQRGRHHPRRPLHLRRPVETGSRSARV